MPSTAHAFDNRSIPNAVASPHKLSRDEMRPTEAAATKDVVSPLVRLRYPVLYHSTPALRSWD